MEHAHGGDGGGGGQSYDQVHSPVAVRYLPQGGAGGGGGQFSSSEPSNLHGLAGGGDGGGEQLSRSGS